MCRNVKNNKEYALKVLNKQFIDEKKTLEFAKSEQYILKTIKDHPFIVKFKESFQNEKNLFLVLEYCSCGNMTKLIKS